MRQFFLCRSFATLSYWQYGLMALALFMVSLAVTLLVLGGILIRLPATYFLDHHRRDLWIDHHPCIRWTGILFKNMAGLGLVLFGLLLSLPGVPGQGLLTILLGLILLDFPGKRRLERWILRRPGILDRVNRLRHRFGRPSLQLRDPNGSPSSNGGTDRAPEAWVMENERA
jgi:hypothetical protein